MCMCVRASWTVHSSLWCFSATNCQFHTLFVPCSVAATPWGILTHAHTFSLAHTHAHIDTQAAATTARLWLEQLQVCIVSDWTFPTAESDRFKHCGSDLNTLYQPRPPSKKKKNIYIYGFSLLIFQGHPAKSRCSPSASLFTNWGGCCKGRSVPSYHVVRKCDSQSSQVLLLFKGNQILNK